MIQEDAAVLEQEMYALLEPTRIKLLSRCDNELAKEFAKPEAIKAK